jgi:mRNA-degrading endonuclease toxin of MazEF toxin-antitoxin module
MDVSQGDIYWVTVRPSETRGSEQHGRRPFIVMSRLAVNKAVKTVVAVPMSTQDVINQPPYRIVIPIAEITKDVLCTSRLELSVAKTDQVRVIDQSRLEEKIGRLSQTATLAVALGLAYIFDIR